MAAAVEPAKKKLRIGDGFTFIVTPLESETLKPKSSSVACVSHFKNGDKVPLSPPHSPHTDRI